MIAYTQQTLTPEQIRRYARQYHDVDMWLLIGQDENFFPFLLGSGEADYQIVYWSKRQGITPYHDDDPVRYYAFGQWLAANAHPVFATRDEAETFARERDWPRTTD